MSDENVEIVRNAVETFGARGIDAALPWNVLRGSRVRKLARGPQRRGNEGVTVSANLDLGRSIYADCPAGD